MYRHFSSQGTHLIKGTAGENVEGLLRSIVVNTPLADGIITLYDENTGDAAGNVIARITYPGTLLNDSPEEVEYNLEFTKGLTVKIEGADVDITVVYS